MEPAVQIENLSRSYVIGKSLFNKSSEIINAVNKVSFSVKKGEAIGLLGPNGAGKTTLIKMLTTVLIPTGGRASIMNMDIVKDAKKIREKINVVYGGDKGLYTRLSARDNLRYFCNLYHIPTLQQKDRIEELLSLVGLLDVADRRVENFSRGMKQKLHIARGLINNPEILFLDEPTIGLDPVSSLMIRGLVKSLNKSGMTIFLTTHYMQEAEEICDRVAIINNGDILLLDQIENIKAKYKKFFYIKLIIEEKYSDRIELLKKKLGNITIDDKNKNFIVVNIDTLDVSDTMKEITNTLNNSEIIDLSVKTSTLEDVYIKIIQNA